VNELGFRGRPATHAFLFGRSTRTTVRFDPTVSACWAGSKPRQEGENLGLGPGCGLGRGRDVRAVGPRQHAELEWASGRAYGPQAARSSSSFVFVLFIFRRNVWMNFSRVMSFQSLSKFEPTG